MLERRTRRSRAPRPPPGRPGCARRTATAAPAAPGRRARRRPAGSRTPPRSCCAAAAVLEVRELGPRRRRAAAWRSRPARPPRSEPQRCASPYGMTTTSPRPSSRRGPVGGHRDPAAALGDDVEHHQAAGPGGQRALELARSRRGVRPGRAEVRPEEDRAGAAGPGRGPAARARTGPACRRLRRTAPASRSSCGGVSSWSCPQCTRLIVERSQPPRVARRDQSAENREEPLDAHVHGHPRRLRRRDPASSSRRRTERTWTSRREEGVSFDQVWLDPRSGKVFCLVTGPDRRRSSACTTRAGHPTDQVYEVPIEL